MSVTPPVRRTITGLHLLWELRPVESYGEPSFACVPLCVPRQSAALFTAAEAPRLDGLGLTTISCWSCRDVASTHPHVAALVAAPSAPGEPLAPRPPFMVTAQLRGDQL